MSFALFHRPGTVVFLDDDPDYLEMLALAMPRQWNLRLFQRPQAALDHLAAEPAAWEADAWRQQALVDRWRAGQPLLPQVLQYWSGPSDRYALTQVVVVDFSMPGMDGLQVLQRLQDWSGSRVLLTGQADEQVAVQAFNRGLIDQFIAKQMPDMARHLVHVVQRLLAQPHARHAHTWRATLRPEHEAVLRLPGVGADLEELASRRWVEHVVLGDPFGVLGLDAAGSPVWLQLEQPAGLPALAETAETAGLPASAVQEIRAGRQLANLEVAAALGRPPALAEAFPVGGSGHLLGALFPLGGSCGEGYAAWLGAQPRRRVEG